MYTCKYKYVYACYDFTLKVIAGGRPRRRTVCVEYHHNGRHRNPALRANRTALASGAAHDCGSLKGARTCMRAPFSAQMRLDRACYLQLKNNETLLCGGILWLPTAVLSTEPLYRRSSSSIEGRASACKPHAHGTRSRAGCMHRRVGIDDISILFINLARGLAAAYLRICASP